MQHNINNFNLSNNIDNYDSVFKIIQDKIPVSIFSIVNSNFFKTIIEEKIIEVFLIKKNQETVSVITVATIQNLYKLKKKFILYLIAHPYKIFVNFSFLLKSIGRDEYDNNFKKNQTLHLLHLVIFKNYFDDISKKDKDKILDTFFKKIIKKYNANSFFLCYEKTNVEAHYFYKRNNFKIYKVKDNKIFVSKEFNL